ncbi:MAG: ERCC4 domain-containing protein [Clostridia bacterium]|nr:ERCC4 domain-containing protein [Clostridia bacterium]
MNIQIDTREKSRAISKIVDYFNSNGINHFSSKLYVGDYMSLDNPRVIIDRKQNLLEICGNVCQQHKRFTDELKRAKQAGIHIVILCEHSNRIKSLEDVKEWKNPRLKESKLAMSGERLYKVLSTMQNSDLYDVEFLFCDKNHTGQRIVELLGG